MNLHAFLPSSPTREAGAFPAASIPLRGEVLVSAVVKQRLGKAFTLDAGGEVEMKGFDRAQRVFWVRP